jgi:ADP-ribosylglycohydrolase
MQPTSHEERLDHARRSLDGLSVGDAFGQRFFTNPQTVERLIALRALPSPPWALTDDSVMAISVVDVLADHRGIDRDRLARLFGARYIHDPLRGYGGTACGVLRRIASGGSWRVVAGSVFDGAGSMGNGGAMRAAPIGAYFAGDLPAAADAARRSAEVTHAHPEGQAGAITVAVASAWAAAGGDEPRALFDTVLAHTPDGETASGIRRAAELSHDLDVRTVAGTVGNGTRVLAQDTVPFALWCASRHVDDFEEAMWTTVAGLGDRDTTCAIVGGILAARPGATIPPEWLAAREPLDGWSRRSLGIGEA